jgi:DNA-binding CsgD family transcriptional regulator
MKDRLMAAGLALIMTLNFVDVVTDISLGVPKWHIFQEAMIVLASGLGVVYLLWEMRKRTHSLRRLTVDLSKADQQLENLNSEMKRARREFSEVIQHQFEQWQLTDSEQQVAMLMLKGLSFKEIATVRDTQEKTVRQQASTIYSKSYLDGRHAFAAWFLEDFFSTDTAGVEAVVTDSRA